MAKLNMSNMCSKTDGLSA